MKNLRIDRVAAAPGRHVLDWSADGKLAFGIGECAAVIYVENFSSLDTILGKQVIEMRKSEPVSQPVDGVVSGDEFVTAAAVSSELEIVQIAWSPTGYNFSNDTCLLALLSNNLNVTILEQYEGDLGPSWRPVIDLSRQLRAGVARMSQNSANKTRIRSFCWAPVNINLFRDERLFAVGLESGEIAVFGLLDNGVLKQIARYSFDKKGYSKAISQLSWSDWRMNNGVIEANIICVFSDNSVASVSLGTVIIEHSLKFRDYNEIRTPGPQVVSRLVCQNTVDHGLMVLLVFCDGFEAHFIEKSQVFRKTLETFGDYEACVTEQGQCLLLEGSGTIELYNIDGSNGIQQDENELLTTFAQSQSTQVRIFGACLSPSKRHIGLLFAKMQPNTTNIAALAHTSAWMNFFPLVTKAETTAKDLLDFEFWARTRAENWLLEYSISKDAFFKNESFDNSYIVEHLSEDFNRALNYSPQSMNWVFDDETGFYNNFQRNLNNLLGSNLFKTLQFFSTIIRAPLAPRYSVSQPPSEDDKQLDLKVYEEKLSSYKKVKKLLEEKQLALLAKLIVDHVDHFPGFLEAASSIENAIYINMLMVLSTILNIGNPKLDSVPIMKFSVMDSKVSFNLSLAHNSNLKSILDADQIEWQRCSLTLLPILTPKVRKCSLCGSTTVLLDGEGDLERALVSVNSCFCCGGLQWTRE